jgi:hypothetical protein
MKRATWLRVALCGLVAGVVWYLLTVVSITLSAPDLIASVQSRAPHPSRGGGFFFALDLLMGIWAVWLYAALAPRYGARPTTAVIAGIAWWTMKTLQSAKWAGLGFVEFTKGLIPVGAMTLVAAVLASMAGAWLYNRVAVRANDELLAP